MYYSLNNYESQGGQSLRSFADDIADHVIGKTNLDDECDFEVKNFFYVTENDNCIEISNAGKEQIESYINAILLEENLEKISIRKYGTLAQQERLYA